MTSNQRKKHKIVWLLLIVIVPILLIFTVINLKNPVFLDSNQQFNSNSKTKQVVLENETFTVFLDQQTTINNSLQIFLKKSLESPSPLVYAVSTDQPKGDYLGALTAKGKYVFNIKRTTESVKIYDAIKKEELINIPLSWD